VGESAYISIVLRPKFTKGLDCAMVMVSADWI